MLTDVKHGGGLIKQQKWRVLCEHAGHRNPRLFAHRQGLVGAVGECDDVHSLQCGSDAFVVVVVKPRPAAHCNYLTHGERKRNGDLLRQHGSTARQLARRVVGEAAAVDFHRTRRKRKVARDCTKQCRLARTVWAEHGHQFAGSRFEADIVEQHGTVAHYANVAR